jgi:hypothetical protein
MKARINKCLSVAAALVFAPGVALAHSTEYQPWTDEATGVAGFEKGGVAKSLSARSVASRGTVTSGITLYGAFDNSAAGTIYVLVRGNSLGTLGVTQSYLDLPTVTLYDSQGNILISSSGSCTGGPVTDYYQNVRGVPAQPRDACIYNNNAQPGPVTFTVTPSAGSLRSGEVLFEVTLGP